MYLALANAYFQSQTKPEAPFWVSIFPFVVIIAIFYFMLIRPQMKQQKDRQKLVDSLKKGDKVITTGGIWGEIDALEAQVVRLKVNDKTKIMVTRSAISGPQPKSDTTEDKKDS